MDTFIYYWMEVFLWRKNVYYGNRMFGIYISTHHLELQQKRIMTGRAIKFWVYPEFCVNVLRGCKQQKLV